jgi:transposase
MRSSRFTPEDLLVLQYERCRHPHPRVQQKMEVVWLKSRGLAHVEIARLAGLSLRSVQRYLDEFLDGGIDRLYQLRWKGTSCPLDDHRDTLEEYFVAHPPRSAREARDVIERLTGVRRSLTRVRVWLKKKSASPGGRSAPSRRRPTPTSKPAS